MRLLKSLAMGLALAALGFASLPVQADTYPGLEHNRLNRPTDAVGTLGNGLFGEQVDLYSGSTEFDTTDIDIPGNSKLPVRLGRHLSVSEYDIYGSYLSAGNWELDVPYIQGYFAQAGWVVGPNSSTSRCSIPAGQSSAAIPPDIYKNFVTLRGASYWSGNRMYIPGSGTKSMLVNNTTSPHPTDGNTYYWVTKDFWTVRCLPTLSAGGAGEGFLAISPDGTQYTFDRMVGVGGGTATGFYAPAQDPKGGTLPDWIYRDKYWMFVSRIQDRFGNYVNYTYNANNQLTAITANDGRAISLTYGTNGQVATASDGTHTWTYQYTPFQSTDTEGYNGDVLSAVVQPDGSSWTYGYSGNLALTNVDPNPIIDGPPRQITCDMIPKPFDYQLTDTPVGAYTLTATHPSGATGTFQFTSIVRGRSYVTRQCTGDGAWYPRATRQFAITSKSLSGPGLPTSTWTYTYSPMVLPQGISYSWAGGTCYPGPCPSTIWTDVTNPDSTLVHRIFGNKFQVNEGQLLETVTSQNSTTLDDTTTAYVGDPTGQPYPAVFGTDPQRRVNVFLAEQVHPTLMQNDLRDGVTFSTQVNSFDAYANPVSATSFSSLGPTRTDITSYNQNTNLWVLNQVQSVQNSNTGVMVFNKTYDPATALLQNVSSYGLFDQSYTFWSDGNLKTVTDGNNHTITLSNYFRGVPQLLQFPNSTSKTAVVDGFGHITGLTDEMSYATGFGYDAMGRLASITQPTGDTVAWTPTTISFAQINAAEYGLPAGHWKQTIATGNATKVNYFDGFWQPVLTQEYDAANVAGTSRFTTKAFDFAGRTSFASYPLASISAFNSNVFGTHTYYDGLGRPISNVQDSELGGLTTTMWYLPGFQTKVTNPRNYATTTSYQVFGSPDTSHPTSIVSPEGATTTIIRDVFGKPLTLTRSGTWNGSPISEARSYVYDANQRLCKRIEPETGATLMDYDGANNIAWTVTGSALTSNACDRASVSAVDKTVRSYNTLNRPLTVTIPNSTNNLSYGYFNDGALQTLTSGSNTWSYSYNKRRLPVTEQLVIDARTKTITHAYNALGQESTLTYPSGLAVATNPNALGQPSQAGTYATAINYFANGGMSGFTYGNGIVHTLTQNTRELPLRSLDIKPGSSAILDDTYSYDANGNVGSITDGTSGNPNNRSMLYDGLDRLTSTSAPHQWWITATSSYDALDNIRQNVVGNRTYNYAYNGNWRLSQLTRPDNSVAYTMGYDAFGNVTSKGAGLDSYVFDAANRMQSVTGKESYVYDGYGRRVKVTRASDNKTDYPIYTMGGQLLTEDDQRSGNTTDYVSLNGSLVAKRSAPINTTTWSTTYEHTDALHSPITETNSSALASRIERYTPFGEPGDNQYVQGPGYTGHVTDALTGLTYAQQRYYDPIIGRFLSVDPMEANPTNGASFNRYNYANGNPYRFTDPDGRESACFSVGLGCGLRPYTANETQQINAMASGLASFIPGADLVGCLRNGCGGGGWSIAAISAVPLDGKVVQGVVKAFSEAKQALVAMAKWDKRFGMTKADMQAYKDLNNELPDPFAEDAVRGPEAHPDRPHGQEPHGHVGPVDHIPIKDAPAGGKGGLQGSADPAPQPYRAVDDRSSAGPGGSSTGGLSIWQ